jgi:hypothetical protein
MTIRNLGAPLSNYQVKIVLDGSFPFGSANADGSDLRVATSDESPVNYTKPGYAPWHIDIVSAPKLGGSQASGILCGMRG